jgi:Cu-processing system permease protein
MIRIIRYVFYDLLRTRFVILFTLFLLFSTLALFQLDSDPGKVILSLMNVVLMAVPLVSIVFSAIHFYNSYEFIELMIAQPVNRKSVFFSEYLGVSGSLSLALLAGTGLPMVAYGITPAGITLLYSGVLLTWVFVALAFLAAVLTRDKARAIGLALLFWFYFSLVYDGLVLWIMYTFMDYPLEKVTLALIGLNPVDLARIILLLQLDISALMGYTGALYKSFFGSSAGWLFAVAALLLWTVLPTWAAMRIFEKKDL